MLTALLKLSLYLGVSGPIRDICLCKILVFDAFNRLVGTLFFLVTIYITLFKQFLSMACLTPTTMQFHDFE